MDARLLGIGMTSQRTRERLVARLREKGIGDERVLDVMRQVPRHLFVDEALATRAYEDISLPIGNSQTISAPFTVARMTEIVAQVQPRRVLEVGTGSGYQTAVLARLVPEVYSVERIAPLLERARRLLAELQVRNVRFRLADGTLGWAEHGPFDAILAAAAPAEIPEALLAQLADGGVLVIPVGKDRRQRLVTVHRRGQDFVREELDPVTFVPMLSGTRR
ncbi:MAG: protein-L-isoaspartate(D-aspartate) O-methyltransferase [Thiohalomonadaceae bacterium]